MTDFTSVELKKISLQALGTNLYLSKKDEYIAKAETIINDRIQEIIASKGADVVSGLESAGNGASDLISSANNIVPTSAIPGASGVLGTGQNAVSQLTNAGGGIPGAGSIPGLPSVPGIPGAPSIPSIPAVPSISSAVPGGISLDPVDYIPDVGGVPFKAFIKPLIDKALSKAFKKFNPASFLQEVQGKLGELQQKTVGGLQGFQEQATSKLEEVSTQASDKLMSTVKTPASDLGALAKKLVSDGEVAKKKTALYIDLFLQRKYSPEQFRTRMLDNTTAKTFTDIDNAQ